MAPIKTVVEPKPDTIIATKNTMFPKAPKKEPVAATVAYIVIIE